jgi:hypothetical protein
MNPFNPDGLPMMDLLAKIESAWTATAVATILEMCRSHPAERFYAAGFWLFYVDYTVVGVPCVAMNTEAHVAVHSETPSVRWTPPNWQFDVINPAIRAMQPLYDALSLALEGKDDPIWDDLVEAHYAAMARVCRRVTELIHSGCGEFAGLPVTKDFVVGIFEERDGEYERLVRASITPERLTVLPQPLWT